HEDLRGQRRAVVVVELAVQHQHAVPPQVLAHLFVEDSRDFVVAHGPILRVLRAAELVNLLRAASLTADGWSSRRTGGAHGGRMGLTADGWTGPGASVRRHCVPRAERGYPEGDDRHRDNVGGFHLRLALAKPSREVP